MDATILHQPQTESAHDLPARVAALTWEVRELAADVDAFRLLAHVAIAEVARLSRQGQSQATTIRTLRDELTRYTAAILEAAA